MVMIRMETQSPPKPVLEEVVATTSISETDFKKLLSSAQQPSAEAYREELRNKFLGTNLRDAGKTVFFKDVNYYGLLPRNFGSENALALGSLSISTALMNDQALRSLKATPQSFTAFMGYPEDASDMDKVFGDQKTASIDIWQKRAEDFRQIATEHGFQLFSASELKTLQTKEGILKQMEQATGIVFIVAHANGCHIRLPGGETVDIAASDILNLKLAKHPFVVLRICNGIDEGFASAFMRAGAQAVWANRGVIDAAIANRHIDLFMKALGEGSSVYDAVQKVDQQELTAEAAAGLFVQLLEPPRTGRKRERNGL
jgi:hypothetical protein